MQTFPLAPTSTQGFSVFVMLAGRNPARKGREVQATPRRGVACTSLPLPCAPLGANAVGRSQRRGTLKSPAHLPGLLQSRE
ncbi:MAG TPA: hypothetical protein VFB60_17060 [Ktedonobacteraceae bacterium]|nr:hypothetical protein [Ktedonobacteraceae bacterium]